MREAIRDGSWLTAERVRMYALMIAVGGISSLLFVWFTGPTALLDRLGRPIGTDFSAFWTSGRMLLEGDTHGMFDPATHFAFQYKTFKDPYVDHYGWHYPPFFLAVAALVATLPYVPALLAWQTVTFAMFAATIRAIAPRHRLVFLATLGFPAVIVTLGHGHNAFLTSALLGTGLVMLDKRPLVAGLCLGLLAYKPQFVIVLPLVLVLGGYWRAALAAAATVVAMIILSTLLLGSEVWSAFAKGAVFTREVILEQGTTGWQKIQSVFSAVRSLGAPVPFAYAAQAIATLIVLAALTAMNLVCADKRLIAAAIAITTLLATPYCLDYDMTILGVAIAFCLAYAAQEGFAPYEKSLLALVWIAPFVARTGMGATGIPIGVLTMIGFFAFVVHRALRTAEVKLTLVQNWSAVRG